jgi:hypothetical protein
LTAKYSYIELENLGYKISNDQFQYAKRDNIQKNLLEEKDINGGGKKKLKTESFEAVNNFLMEHSSESNKCLGKSI